MILHITSRAEWLAAQKSGEHRAPSLEKEGFIHCSTEKQIVSVANAFYRGQKDLVLLVIDETRLRSEVRWEAPAGMPADGISESDRFPHIYGPINTDAVASVLDFEPDSNGLFILPPFNY
ncbi:MAG: DUF952 domain-containing protein [Chloroflexota bacterium]